MYPGTFEVYGNICIISAIKGFNCFGEKKALNRGILRSYTPGVILY